VQKLHTRHGRHHVGRSPRSEPHPDISAACLDPPLGGHRGTAFEGASGGSGVRDRREPSPSAPPPREPSRWLPVRLLARRRFGWARNARPATDHRHRFQTTEFNPHPTTPAQAASGRGPAPAEPPPRVSHRVMGNPRSANHRGVAEPRYKPPLPQGRPPTPRIAGFTVGLAALSSATAHGNTAPGASRGVEARL